MRLYDEIFLDADGESFSRCIFVPNGGGYFEGVKGVEDFSTERVVVCFPRKTVEVRGNNLSIKKYCDGDLQISGRILSCEVLLPQTAEKPRGKA